MAMHFSWCVNVVNNFSVKNLTLFTRFRNFTKSSRVHFNNGLPQHQETVEDSNKIEDQLSSEIFTKVNEQIVNKTHGRLFAVVQIMGYQYKITTEDLVVVRQNWPPTAGDKIRLEKVLLVGSSDFTLVGRPLLPLDQVTIYATVIEKTLSQTIPRVTFKPRRNNLKCNFYKDELTFLRITDINLTGKVNDLGDSDGLKDRIF